MGTGSSGLSRKSGGGGSVAAPQKAPASPFSATDTGAFRTMSNSEESAYYTKQNLTAAQQAAFDDYTNPNTERGSLYNFSQNMNYNYANGLPMTPRQQAVFNEINGAMHNLGYNATLTRYDHADTINQILQQAGVRGNAANMSPRALKNALVGVSYKDNRILSTSVNDFKNSSDPSVFRTRQFKITYQAKAGTQAVMPGVGKTPMRGSGKSKGDDFGEMLLGLNNNYSIKDVKYSGARARGKGGSRWNLNKKQIEIVVEVG